MKIDRTIDAENLARPARRELSLIVAILLISGSLWAFVAVSEGVVEGSTHVFDEMVLLSMRAPQEHSDPIGPGWVEEFARDVTALGSVGVLTFITLAAAGFLALRGKGRAAVFVIAAIAGGIALSFGLKSGFDRPRPDLVSHGSTVFTASFPSAHSMMSAVVYLTLGTLLARFQSLRRLKIYAISLAVLITLAVGVSRVYLGVHWPTDVLAGWAGGAAWAMLCWAILLWLQRKQQIEETAVDEAEADAVTDTRSTTRS